MESCKIREPFHTRSIFRLKNREMGCYYFPNWGKAIEGAGLDYTEIKKKPGPLKREKDSV